MRGNEQVPDLDRYLSSAKPAFPNIITLAHTTDPRFPLNPPKPAKSRRQIAVASWWWTWEQTSAGLPY